MTSAILTIVLALGGALCGVQAVRGLRGGPLWIDGFDAEFPRGNTLQPHPRRLIGRGARVLGLMYLVTAVGCVLAILSIWAVRTPAA